MNKYTYVIGYFDLGTWQYERVVFEARDVRESQDKAKQWLIENHKDAYDRGEWNWDRQ